MTIIAFHKLFQSTPSVGRATTEWRAFGRATLGISIHALRGEGDNNGLNVKVDDDAFQSTPSVGRATRENIARVCH